MKFSLALMLVLTSSGFTKNAVVPEISLDLFQENLVLKNAKGTLLQEDKEDTPENWFNLSPFEDNVEGVGTERVYAEFGMPESEDIIVAVIDSGVDVNHEDLQGKIWINDKEIANNGIDDDENGYIDDVFGWNFIGGSKGMGEIVNDTTLDNGIRLIKGDTAHQIDADTLEVTRELVRMKKLKAQLESEGKELTKEQTDYLATISKEVTSNYTDAKESYDFVVKGIEIFKKNAQILKDAGVKEITLEEIEILQTSEPEVLKAKNSIMSELRRGRSEKWYQVRVDYYGTSAKYYYNEDFNPRTIVGDNYSDSSERIYGNNDVIGPDSSHGTHVSGIIAATRNNDLGMKGVATNVKIMAIRCVPNGDERDKDVANSIRYAVDNGAKIINMSFGKSYSPYQSEVDNAVKYAESKGVLLVHAAGNSSMKNNNTNNFPNKFLNSMERKAHNWLEIGASGFQKGKSLVARFSNYSKEAVDVFSPGVDIFSTTPDNKYDTYSGTSMAAPAAAGVAALVLSYKPTLNVKELKASVLQTSTRYPLLYVNKPGTQTPILFSNLSTNGGIVNAYSAVQSVLK